jgi:hypothetical protein
LALLINTQNQSPVGRRKIQSNDVVDLIDEQWIAGKLEAFFLKPSALFANCIFMKAKFRADFLARQSIGASKDNATTITKRARCQAAANLLLKIVALISV